MKYIHFITFCLLATLSFSQVNIEISGQVINHTGQEIYLTRTEGKQSVTHLTAKLDKDGKFEMKGSVPDPDYYVLKINDKNSINVVLQGDDHIKIYTDENNTTDFTNIIGSQSSQNIHRFLKDYSAYRNQTGQLQAQARTNPAAKDSLAKLSTQLTRSFNFKRDRFARENANSPGLIVILNLYDKKTEFKAYEKITTEMIKSFPASPTIKRAQQELAYHKKQQNANLKTAIGKDAPEISMTDPDGKTIKLSDLKGKVVLIDFWASWCRPCRAENPNVVKLYEKYKKKGFTVYSVSMDSQKEKWLAAIEKDNLSWPNHVSDLKGWTSSGGRTYGVTSIPTTYLIGKDGKIINKNLRGHNLDAALKDIFGF